MFTSTPLLVTFMCHDDICMEMVVSRRGFYDIDKWCCIENDKEYSQDGA